MTSVSGAERTVADDYFPEEPQDAAHKTRYSRWIRAALEQQQQQQKEEDENATNPFKGSSSSVSHTGGPTVLQKPSEQRSTWKGIFVAHENRTLKAVSTAAEDLRSASYGDTRSTSSSGFFSRDPSETPESSFFSAPQDYVASLAGLADGLTALEAVGTTAGLLYAGDVVVGALLRWVPALLILFSPLLPVSRHPLVSSVNLGTCAFSSEFDAHSEYFFDFYSDIDRTWMSASRTLEEPSASAELFAVAASNSSSSSLSVFPLYYACCTFPAEEGQRLKSPSQWCIRPSETPLALSRSTVFWYQMLRPHGRGTRDFCAAAHQVQGWRQELTNADEPSEPTSKDDGMDVLLWDTIHDMQKHFYTCVAHDTNESTSSMYERATSWAIASFSCSAGFVSRYATYMAELSRFSDSSSPLLALWRLASPLIVGDAFSLLSRTSEDVDDYDESTTFFLLDDSDWRWHATLAVLVFLTFLVLHLVLAELRFKKYYKRIDEWESYGVKAEDAMRQAGVPTAATPAHRQPSASSRNDGNGSASRATSKPPRPHEPLQTPRRSSSSGEVDADLQVSKRLACEDAADSSQERTDSGPARLAHVVPVERNWTSARGSRSVASTASNSNPLESSAGGSCSPKRRQGRKKKKIAQKGGTEEAAKDAEEEETAPRKSGKGKYTGSEKSWASVTYAEAPASWVRPFAAEEFRDRASSLPTATTSTPK